VRLALHPASASWFAIGDTGDEQPVALQIEANLLIYMGRSLNGINAGYLNINIADD
jgi:hypothetical protein